MVYDKVLSGKFVELHSVTPEDAEFILKLRQNDEIARYLHRIDNSVEQQIDWIKLHQKLDGDYYFLIWSKNTRERLGTISLYDKKDDHCEICLMHYQSVIVILSFTCGGKVFLYYFGNIRYSVTKYLHSVHEQVII